MDTRKEVAQAGTLPSARVKFLPGRGGLPMLAIETAVSVADVYLLGAHMTRFQRRNQPPLLFLSESSRFAEGQPIRGGIPIIFPWFGARAGAAAHGFARNKTWQLKEIISSADGGTTSVRLRLPDDAETTGFAPFACEYVVTVGEKLELRLEITNQSNDRDLVFENCLHTYFSIGDIGAVAVGGLKNIKYRDKTDNFAEKTETNDAITISSEVDRVYQDTTHTVEIRDPKLRRTIIVEKANSHSTVVWNPWIAKAKQMPDFGDEEYKQMVCVESGNVGKNQLTLPPGQSTALSVSLSSKIWPG